jgi:hypothetical protein
LEKVFPRTPFQKLLNGKRKYGAGADFVYRKSAPNFVMIIV